MKYCQWSTTVLREMRTYRQQDIVADDQWGDFKQREIAKSRYCYQWLTTRSHSVENLRRAWRWDTWPVNTPILKRPRMNCVMSRQRNSYEYDMTLLTYEKPASSRPLHHCTTGGLCRADFWHSQPILKDQLDSALHLTLSLHIQHITKLQCITCLLTWLPLPLWYTSMETWMQDDRHSGFLVIMDI